MNYKLRTNKAFTLIELVVAIAILAMVLSFAGVIFKVSIGAFRTGIANAEIMRKMRAITDQLNTDFKDIRKDAPLLIQFRKNPTNPGQRYDQIMFFPVGDFQSTQLYFPNPLDPILDAKVPAPTGTPIRGNLARIYYGQAGVNRTLPFNPKFPWKQINKKRVLARSQHILTADTSIFHWFADFNDFKEPEVIHLRYQNNDFYEHDRLSLSEWKAVGRIPYRDQIIPACFKKRPLFDIYDPNTFHKLMSESVGSFAVQWAYWDPGPDPTPIGDQYRWFPSDDPDGVAATDDSHFLLMDPGPKMKTEFGVSFNTPAMPAKQDWYRIGDGRLQYRLVPPDIIMTFSSDFYPKALKFTFTLYDSMGIIEDGRRFTHIVYIGE